jgi:cold shock protein
MKNPKALTYICLAITLSTSCNKPSQAPAGQQVAAAQAKRYQLKGKVVSIDKQSKMVNIDSEAIPGYMDAMTMPYNVKPESDLDKLKPGDAITADLVVQDEKAWLENIAITQETGIVKWFNDAKGYGMISRQSGEDVSFQFSAIQSNGFRSLQEGQQVSFDVVKGTKGLEAKNVKMLGTPQQGISK